MASSSSTTLKSISDSLLQIDSKKSSLKKAFDDLQSHSSLLLSSDAFSLCWSDLDSHFSAFQSSLAEKFRILESLSAAKRIPEPSPGNSPEIEVSARSELVALCEAMDGLGLRRFVSEATKDRNAVRSELPSAVRRAPDAAAMVIGAMEGFYGGAETDLEMSGLRRSCVLLLEVLITIGARVGGDVRGRALAMAKEWRSKMSAVEDDGESLLEALGFLHLVAAFGLSSEFESDEIVDCVVVVAKYRQTVVLCRKIGLGDKAEDLVTKLINKGKHILAVKFVFEFGLSEKFPPVPLLKAHVKESKKIAKSVCKEGNNSLKALNEATAKEVSALRSVIKVIEERKLESEFPTEQLMMRIDELEKERIERKRAQRALPANTLAQKPYHQPPSRQQNGGNKRPRTDFHSGPKSVPKNFRASNPSPVQYHQNRPFQHHGPHFQRTGLSASDGPAPYLVGPRGFVGTQMGVPGNNNASHLRSAEPYAPSSYYEMPTSYGGGYGLPPQYPSQSQYYPQ